jgi:hypothetical protein
VKRKVGDAADIRQLFGAMAASLGMDARYALVGDRDERFFRQDFPHSSTLPNALIAVKVGEGWRFFDPAQTYVPADMLPWQHEGMTSLVSDAAKPTFVTTPISAPTKSAIHRTADFKLLPDGTLEGDAKVEFVGHQGAEEKELFDDMDAAEQEKYIKDALQERLGTTTEVSKVAFSNVKDPNATVSYTYHVKVPGYAQKTGRRLFLQPGFFQKGIGPRFTAEKRVHPVYFAYPWVEDQTITIELPDGFELDNPDAPPPFAQRTFVSQDIDIAVSNDKKVVRYTRKTGLNGNVMLFKPEQYPALKQLFDLYHSRDNHSLSLRQQ